MQPHSVGHSANLVLQQPTPFNQPIVPTTQAAAIPLLHSHLYSQPYYSSQYAISDPISHVQGPSFHFFGE